MYFFNLQYVYNFVVLIQYTAVYIYINIFFIVLLLIIITEKVHIIYAYKIIAGRNGKKKQGKEGHKEKRN